MIADTTVATRSSSTAAAGRGTTSAAVTARSTRAALGIRYTSNALAQEKTGEFWVDGQLFGRSRCHTTGDYERAQVAVFWGKNPWQSHGFPQARKILKEIANDPARTLIVVDPRRTEIGRSGRHPPAPATRAATPICWPRCSAMLVEENLLADRWLAEQRQRASTRWSPICARSTSPQSCDRAGVDEATSAQAARAIGTATGGVSIFEDLGIQMAPHSTLNSYLEKLVVLLTGNFGVPGGDEPALALRGAARRRRQPPAGRRRAGHARSPAPPRHRAGAVQRDPRRDPHRPSRPLPGDARRVAATPPTRSPTASACARRSRALDLVVVIDVALTETARAGRLRAARGVAVREVGVHVLQPRVPAQLVPPAPAALRAARRHAARVRDPRPAVPGPGRATPTTISRRCTRPPQPGGPRSPRRSSRSASPSDPSSASSPPVMLYETLGPDADDAGWRAGGGAAAVWGLAQRCALAYADSIRRAGIGDDGASARRRAVRRDPRRTARRDVHDRRVRRDVAPAGDRRRKVSLAIPALLAELDTLPAERLADAAATFPFVLLGRRAPLVDGQHHPARSRVAQEGPAGRAAGVDPDDADAPRADRRRSGADHDQARVSGRHRRGHRHAAGGSHHAAERLRPRRPAGPSDAVRRRAQRADVVEDRDWFAGTPHHKHVRARLEKVAACDAAHPVRRLAVPDRPHDRSDRRLVDAARCMREAFSGRRRFDEFQTALDPACGAGGAARSGSSTKGMLSGSRTSDAGRATSTG